MEQLKQDVVRQAREVLITLVRIRLAALRRSGSLVDDQRRYAKVMDEIARDHGLRAEVVDCAVDLASTALLYLAVRSERAEDEWLQTIISELSEPGELPRASAEPA